MSCLFYGLVRKASIAGVIAIVATGAGYSAPALAAGAGIKVTSAQRVKSEQVQAANRLASVFADTWNRRDGRGYGEAYWPDAELVDPSGQIWNGRAAIVQTHVDLWRGPARASHMVASVRRIRTLGPRLFIVDIDTSATGFSPPPPGAHAGVVRTHLKHVVEKRLGRWKVLSSQNTFIASPTR
jgi:uncharacterized protein (TIGR02246 family)